MSCITLCIAALTLQPAPADLVIDNARIWSDGMVGFAEFAAVRDGRFVHVGDRQDELIGTSERLQERVERLLRLIDVQREDAFEREVRNAG